MQAQYKIYDSYKDSGVPWLGEIPEDWNVTRNLGLFDERKEINFPDAELLSVTIEHGIIKQSEITTKKDSSNEDKGKYKRVLPDDLAYNKMRMWQGAIGRSDYDGIVSPAYIILEPRKKAYSRFYHYLYRTGIFIREANRNSYGLCDDMNSLRYEDFKTIYSPVPPEDQVNRIVVFLDQKTAEIDAAIEKKQQLIELLKEQKSILINQAVTKGLNPNAPMKDSGIEWIGHIPAHWEVEKLFGLCRFVRGNSAFAKDELLSNGQYVALQYGKTYKVDEVDDSYGFYVNEEFYKESQVVSFGDIIFISTSETIEDLGHSVIYNRDDVGLLGGEQLIIKPNSDLLDHYYTYYSTKVFSKTLRKYATGIKVFRFNINDLKTIYIAVPPKDEQAKIASFIKGSLKQLDKAMDLQQAQIEKLQEFKQTLIAHAVTGKIKV